MELKMPEHMPREYSSCAHAAHHHTLHARIHKPAMSMGRITEANAHTSHESTHESKNDSGSLIQPAARYEGGNHGQTGRDNKAGGHDDSGSVASSDSNYAGCDPNKTYSIVIPPIHGGREAMSAVLLMKAHEAGVQVLCDQDKDFENHSVSQHLAFDNADGEMFQSHMRYQSSYDAFPKKQHGQPIKEIANVVPKVDLICPPGGASMDHISSLENSPSKLGGWSVRHKKKKSLNPVVSVDPDSPTQKIAVLELHPKDDPGIAGVGWVEGTTTGKGASGRVHTLEKPSKKSRDASRQEKEGSTSQSPTRQVKPSRSPTARRAVGIVGMVPINASSRGAKDEPASTVPSSSDVKTGRRDLTTGETENLATPNYDGELEKVISTRGSVIHEGILEKLRVWVDEEVEDQEDDFDSDDPDPVTTAKAMPARPVQFLKSPRTQKHERAKTPNTSREEQLCVWEDSTRNRGSRSAHDRNAVQSQQASHSSGSRRVSTQSTGIHIQEKGSNTPLSGASGRASRYMTGDSCTVHEYVAVQHSLSIPEHTWRQKLAARTPHLTVVSFFQEPTSGLPMGIIMRGGKVRSQLFENPKFPLQCDQVMERTNQKEESVQRFLPVPMGEAARKDYSNMLHTHGIEPLEMEWGSGMAMKHVSVNEVFHDDGGPNWKQGLNYYPKQKVPGSEVRSLQNRRRKIIRINPSGDAAWSKTLSPLSSCCCHTLFLFHASLVSQRMLC